MICAIQKSPPIEISMELLDSFHHYQHFTLSDTVVAFLGTQSTTEMGNSSAGKSTTQIPVPLASVSNTYRAFWSGYARITRTTKAGYDYIPGYTLSPVVELLQRHNKLQT